MKSMNNIFSKHKGLKKVSKRLKDQRIIELNWTEIFGQMATQLFNPCLYGNTLSISTSNPSWAQEIQFYKKEFLSKINKLLKVKVDNIYVSYKRKPLIEVDDTDKYNPNEGLTLLEKIQRKERRGGFQ